MRCPFCHNADSRVIDSREADEGATTRRRRSCPKCGRRFTTVEEAVLAVVKRSGVSEPFNRSKVVAGVRRACQGRPVDEDQLQLLAQQVEDAIRATGAAEVPSQRGRAGHPAAAPRARRGRLPALRERLPRPSPRSRTSRRRSPSCKAPAVHGRPSRPDPSRTPAPRPPAPENCQYHPLDTSQSTTDRGSSPAADPPPRAPAPRTHTATRRPGRAPHHDRDRRPLGRLPHPPQRQGAQPGQGPQDQARLHHRRCAPLRRGDLGAPRRRHDQLARRLDQLRAARRGVPRRVEHQRHQHRHHEVLPWRGRPARSARAACVSSSTGSCSPTVRPAASTATSPPRATPRSSSTS